MKVVSFFSGVAMFDLGLTRAGMTVVGACEIDPFARKVYAARMGTPAWFPTDITKVRPEDIPDADVWVGGSPCQSFSVAGGRAGLEGTSGLLLTWIALMKAKRPEWVIIENVPGMLTGRDEDGEEEGADPTAVRDVGEVDAGRPAGAPVSWFGAVLGALADAGYRDVVWRTIDGQFFGVPQRRRRVFVVCHLGDGTRAGEVLLEPEGVRRNPAKGGQARKVAPAGTPRGAGGSGVASALTAGDGHHGRRSPRGDGADNLIPTVFNWQAGGTQAMMAVSSERTSALGTSQTPAVAFVPMTFRSTGGSHSVDASTETAPTLKVGSGLGIPSGPAVAFVKKGRRSAGPNGEVRATVLVGPAKTLTTSNTRLDFETETLLPAKMPDTLTLQGILDSLCAHADATETGPREVLRLLREADGEKAGGRRGSGEFAAFFAAALLRPSVHGAGLQGEIQGERASGAGQVSGPDVGAKREVRIVRGHGPSPRRASSRREPAQQRDHESRGAVSVMPPSQAQDAGDVLAVLSSGEGARLLRQALPAIQEAWRSTRGEDQSAPRAGVRRLTPAECEKLMGLTPGWTCLCGCAPYSTAACKCPDGPRYRVIGNGGVVPCMEWIGRRLMKVAKAAPRREREESE